MLKKKSTLAFKPRAPQARRQPGAPPSAASSARPSVERQSRTPAPATGNSAHPSSSILPQIQESGDEDATPQESTNIESHTSIHPQASSREADAIDAQDQPTTRDDLAATESVLSTSSIPISTPTQANTRNDKLRTGQHPYGEDDSEVLPLTGSSANQGLPSMNKDSDIRSGVRGGELGKRGLERSSQDQTTSATRPTTNPIETADKAANRSSFQTSIVQTDSVALDVSAVIHNAAGSIRGDTTSSQDIPPLIDSNQITPTADDSSQPSLQSSTAEVNPSDTSVAAPLFGSLAEPQPSKKTKRSNNRRRQNDDVSAVRPSIEDETQEPPQSKPKKTRKPRNETADVTTSKKRRREETPEEAEDQEIDHSTMKMADLTRDLRIGKKFSRHAEIKRREIERKAKAKLARDHPELVQSEENRASSRAPGQEEIPEISSAGPQMRIVNGQIVIDDASLVVDRHARAAAAASVMEEVEEDDFSRLTTSGTYMKRERNISWDEDSLEKFYNGLRMFGTDFEMISKMFPDRSRRQIKLKFNKEERENSERISNALIGETLKIDLEEYKSHTGLEYEETADIEAEHARMEEEHNAEQDRMQAEADETTRQKKAVIQGRTGEATSVRADGTRVEGGGGTDSAKENEPAASGTSEGGKASAASKSKKKVSKKKGKPLHSMRGGGEEVEVLGSIDDFQT